MRGVVHRMWKVAIVGKGIGSVVPPVGVIDLPPHQPRRLSRRPPNSRSMSSELELDVA